MLLFSAIHPDVGQELWRIDLPGVAGRHLFYNGSRADGGDLGADARDDAAIATGKFALRGGNGGTFANVTNYVRGINGIMVDVSALPEGVTPTADDFTFRAFTPGGPVGGTPVAPPGAITVRRGAGASGTDRVTLVWSDAAVRNGWLQVTVKANGRTGLTAPDTFVFGNLVGDTGGPGLRVDAADVLGTRLHLGHTDAAALDRYDFSRDGRINPQDLMIARMSWARALALPSAPAASVAAASVLPTAPTSRSARRPIVRGILSDGADNLLS
jgi:hypothetical protein